MDLDECFRNGTIKKSDINVELIKSLIDISNIKEIAVKTAKINDVTISAYVSLAYDSLREALEALCISKGYKVLSHICIGELLEKLLDGFDYDEFDRFRYIRNGINYYGTKVDLKQGKKIIAKMFVMKNSVINKYLKRLLS